MGWSAFDQIKEAEKKIYDEKMDPLKRGATQQSQFAEQLEKSAPQLKRNAYSGVAALRMRELAKGLQDIRSGANARGLLFSGIRQGQEANAAVQTANQLAQAKTEINTDIQDLIDQARAGAMSSWEDIRGIGQSSADAAYQAALQRFRDSQETYAQLGRAAGTIGGAAIGRATAKK